MKELSAISHQAGQAPGPSALNVAAFSDEHVKLVNELVPRLTGRQAYFVGLGSAIALLNRLEPTRGLLARCADSNSKIEALQVCEDWVKRKLKNRGAA